MKSNKIIKKLVLNKSTVFHLNVNDLKKVQGGVDPYTIRTMCGISGCPFRFPFSNEDDGCNPET